MLIQPKSIDECVYFTNRVFDKGKLKAWVFRELCPKCSKVLMSKPKNAKGKIRIRANYYECSECKNQIPETEYEETLTANIEYTCPFCQHKSEIQIPFNRKKVKRFDEETGKKQTVESLRFQCENCKKDIDITKKMK